MVFLVTECLYFLKLGQQLIQHFSLGFGFIPGGLFDKNGEEVVAMGDVVVVVVEIPNFILMCSK